LERKKADKQTITTIILNYKAKELTLRIKAAIFDLDGTLIDSLHVYYKDINEIFKRVGLPPVKKETVFEIMREGKSPWDSLLPPDIGNNKELLERCHAIDNETWTEIYEKEADLFPNTGETLKKIQAAGMKIGIVTSGWEENDEIKNLLIKRDVYSLIDVIITRTDVTKAKPAPDPILACIDRLGLTPKECLYVGDAPSDIVAGKAAGVMTVGVLTGVSDYKRLEKEKPSLIIKDISEVPDILEDRAKE